MAKAHKLFRLIKRVNRLVDERPDEVRRGIDRAARVADQKTRGKYSRQIGRGARMAGRYLDSRRHRRHH